MLLLNCTYSDWWGFFHSAPADLAAQLIEAREMSSHPTGSLHVLNWVLLLLLSSYFESPSALEMKRLSSKLYWSQPSDLCRFLHAHRWLIWTVHWPNASFSNHRFDWEVWHLSLWWFPLWSTTCLNLAHDSFLVQLSFTFSTFSDFGQRIQLDCNIEIGYWRIYL